MISESELRDRSIVFQNGRNVAAELLKTLKRDVPFESEKDILEAHDRLTYALYEQYCIFREKTINPTNDIAHEVEVPKAVQPTPAATKAEEAPKSEPVAVTATKEVTTSEPAVLAMVEKAVNAVTTKEACQELKSKVLNATKLSLQDKSMLLAKLDARIAAF